jgi:hypothetical protein
MTINRSRILSVPKIQLESFNRPSQRRQNDHLKHIINIVTGKVITVCTKLFYPGLILLITSHVFLFLAIVNIKKPRLLLKQPGLL